MPQKYDKIKVVKEDEFMKNICCKKMWNLFAVVVFTLILYACAETTGVYQTGDSSTETDSQRSETKISRTNQQAVPVKKISLYQVSLEEIAERIEYEYVYENSIYQYNICSSPKYDYENTPLAAYIEESYVTETEEMSKRTGNELIMEIDYHQFDFNGDGVEDYLLCVWGSLYCGSGGNTVEIWIQEEGGVRKVLDITTRLHNSLSDHGMLTVLDEKTGGYYAIVLPESNYILRYDEETGQYDFGDIVRNEKSE